MTTAEIDRGAVLSPDRVYRYELHRTWSAGPRVAWIMLNPSTADAEQDDATIRRCIGFAKSWGLGGIVVRNLFALRATDPRDLRTHPDPIGPRNDEVLRNALAYVDDLVVCAWGAHGVLRGRGPEVLARLADRGVPHHLGLTKDGAPRHPLRLPRTLTPQRWAAS